MATSMCSCGIIVPESRYFVIVNAEPGEQVDEIIVLNPSSSQAAAMIQDHDELHLQSMFFFDDDNEPAAYTTLQMEFTMNKDRSIATATILDDDNDDESCMVIARFLIQVEFESFCANAVSEENILKQEEEQGSEMCAICLKEYEADEIMGRLECRHGYHSQCIKKWLVYKNTCPICRATLS